METNGLLRRLAGISLLASAAVLPSAADAAGGQVPKECQEPNLSAADEATCDFIARTANRCHSPRMSARTRRLCDQLGAPDDNFVSPDVPADIVGGPDQADPVTAAAFAWREFIALNWPALAGTRDTPAPEAKFGEVTGENPLVWQTYRHKVEIYPGQGSPPGLDPSKSDFGYSTVPPRYIYNAQQLGQGANGTGEVPPCPGQEPVASPSFINLDEVSQIGLDSMFAGKAPQVVSLNSDPQLIRFLAKANGIHFAYVVNPDALVQGGDPLYVGTKQLPEQTGLSSTNCSELQPGETTTFCTAQANFLEVARGNGNPTTLQEPFISFPVGTIHVKSAWRELTIDEEQSGRFYIAPVRYYEENPENTQEPRCYREGMWGLLALHIEHKTPTAPYFIFATFEQADNVQTSDGISVEDESGQMIVNPPGDFITDPPLDYEDGDPPTLVPEADYCESPGKRLFYIEESDLSGLPSGGAICQNVRTVETHPAVIAANQSAHAAISAYASSNGIENPVWLYYRLVNVQYKPFDLSQADFDPPTITSDVSFVTFYTANVVVETDITLANFSGRISNAGPSTNLPANFDHFNGRTTFQNVLLFNDDHELESTFNMGGCLGCHGIAQVQNGTDFSFILSGGRVPVPETPNVDPPGTTNPAPVGLP